MCRSDSPNTERLPTNARHAYLFNDLIILTKLQGGKGEKKSEKFRDAMLLRYCTLENVEDTKKKKNSIMIIVNPPSDEIRYYHMMFRTPGAKTQWLKVNELIQKEKSQQPSIPPGTTTTASANSTPNSVDTKGRTSKYINNLKKNVFKISTKHKEDTVEEDKNNSTKKTSTTSKDKKSNPSLTTSSLSTKSSPPNSPRSISPPPTEPAPQLKSELFATSKPRNLGRPLPPVPVKVNRERPKSIFVDNIEIDLGNVAGMESIVFDAVEEEESESDKEETPSTTTNHH